MNRSGVDEFGFRSRYAHRHLTKGQLTPSVIIHVSTAID